MIRKFFAFIFLLICAASAFAQIIHPVKWDSSITMLNDTEGQIVLSANIDDGWHMYGFDLPDGGPRSTSITFSNITGASLMGDIIPSATPKEEVDMMFALKLRWWTSSVKFIQNFKLLSGSDGCSFKADIIYQACDNSRCIPPTKESFDLKIGNDNAAVQSPADSLSEMPVVKTTAALPSDLSGSSQADWWRPVKFPDAKDSDTSWLYIFIWGFIGGLLALLTPCVWPMIPLTVSFFLKKSASRRRSIADAMIYGSAIIVIYLVLGLAITMLFGAGKLNELATNAIFNIAFFLLLLVFAISFFGAFDIKLPASWSNKMDSKAERTTGLISIFFMAFTLVLVSFSCTGPIIGTLLVEAASDGNKIGPAIGMGAFALALAIPFALFAIFPTFLKEMPKSGGWLNSVKVVLGFLELALSLKFLSVADLAYGWRILDREIFIALWIVIFVLLGMYLIGKLRFSHDSIMEHVPIPRFFMALASFSLAVYLLPGMWGAPLKGVSAFVPPLYTQDFNLYSDAHAQTFDDYDAGMRFAEEHKMPVLIDFSGYGCVNCRKMEGAVFDNSDVKEIINNKFVMITLMVDDKKSLPSPIKVQENNKMIVLETIGDKWSYLQRYKFAASTQPYYVVLNNNGEPMESPYYYNESVPEFIDWLENALKNYSKD